jgi:hypothetical protein
MNITKALELFTYTPTEALEISTSTSIDNINYIISINENNVFLRYTPGAPEFLQGFTSLESGKGYCLSSKTNAIPYEFYASTDDVPDSVTLNQLYQIATYCGTGFNLLGITITSQPSNAELSGDTASFSVEATVVGGVSLTYQWQISTDDGANWNDINGETNATLNLSGLDSNDIGNQYRVIVGATGEDSVTSNAVSFTATTTTTTTTTPPVYWTQVGADIDGEAAEDYSGYSVALSSDGSRIAIGATFNDGAAVWAGHVRVYDLIGSTWTQVGADIDGEAVGDESGASVALSSDGSRIAIGAIYNDGADVSAGHVRVYDLIGSTWTQVGSDIDGEAAGDYSGHSVALSSDGSRVAVGAILNDGTGTNAGHVRVFDLVGSTWTQVGADIDGEAAGDQSGFSVALSSDGSRVAIGAYANEGNGVYAGHVRVFDLVGTTWTQVGADIDGEAANDNSGRSIALSSDGSRIAIGANVNSGAGLRAGHVRVFDLVGSTWTQVGVDIDGETATGQSGWSVAMSSDGSRVVVGAPYNDGGGDNSGHVRVYDLVGSSWTQVGADIDSEAAGDFSGYSVAISSDGSRVAIGATNNDGTGTNAGHVRIFDFNS